jgi:hypothetical protein
MEHDADAEGAVVRELPQPGVYDPILLKRLRACVDLLEANDLEHLDFGLLDRPVPDADPGDYGARFGAEPTWGRADLGQLSLLRGACADLDRHLAVASSSPSSAISSPRAA